jgi:hypothetical protein
VVVAIIERVITSEPWYVTASVALGAALLGSVVGAVSTYRLNVALDNRSREARAEIRRKAKIYTPIRAELLALRDAIARDEHLNYFQGILREDRGYRTMVNPPELYFWRQYTEDGRAMASASARVGAALDALDSAADAFNAALHKARDVFQERGDVILGAAGIETNVSNWIGAEAVPLIHRRFADLFSGPIPQPLDAAMADRLRQSWDDDAAINAADSVLHDAVTTLRTSLDAAITEVERAMQRIARKHESEPED